MTNESTRLIWISAVNAAKSGWYASELTAWNNYTSALAALLPSPPPQQRRLDPAVIVDSIDKYYFTLEGTPSSVPPPAPVNMTAADIQRLEAIATQVQPTADSAPAALTLIDVIVTNAAQRANAYDALLIVYRNWMYRPGIQWSLTLSSEDLLNYTAPRNPGNDTLAAALRATQDRVNDRMTQSTDALVQARLGALLLTGPIGAYSRISPAVLAVRPRSESGQVSDAWAVVALNVQLERAERSLSFAVQYKQWQFEHGMRLTLSRPGIRETMPAAQLLNGVAPAVYTNSPDPSSAFHADIDDLYLTYARHVLSLLDMFPNRSERSRLLNALEVISGKILIDGQTTAAATILEEEATRFRDNVQNANPDWKTSIFTLITVRAQAYREFAPRQVADRADALNAAAEAARTVASGLTAGTDKDFLTSLASESSVQANLLRVTAETSMKTLVLGMLSEFQRLAQGIFDHNYPLIRVPNTNAGPGPASVLVLNQAKSPRFGEARK